SRGRTDGIVGQPSLEWPESGVEVRLRLYLASFWGRNFAFGGVWGPKAPTDHEKTNAGSRGGGPWRRAGGSASRAARSGPPSFLRGFRLEVGGAEPGVPVCRIPPRTSVVGQLCE